MKKRWLFLTGIIFLCVYISNCLVGKSVKKLDQPLPIVSKSDMDARIKARKKSKLATPKKEKSAWKETDPKELEAYGITITPKVMEPTTEKEWETYVAENFEKFQVLESEEAKKAIGNMQTTEGEYHEKMGELDGHIDIIKDRLNDDPFNRDHATKLQNTYKMKAIGRVLKDRLIAEEAQMPQEENLPPLME